ncbi:HNH endonuclease signature motif containing protein [Parafrigoribacterium mesophilum]|uniref:HNH endonuclease signature motif containing protein n=1 Tax=Parafrigoribacterium mesophilum TaxID=433646 RepID=UPI0031FCC0F5
MKDIFDVPTPDAAELAAMGIAPWELDGPLAWECEDWDAEGWTPEGWVDPRTDPAEAVDLDPLGDDPVGSIDVSEAIRVGVGRVTELQAQMSRLQALQMRELADLEQRTENALPQGATQEQRDWAHRSMAAELAVACRVSTATMQSRLSEAQLMVQNFPAAVQALHAGRIQAGHLRAIALYGRCIDDADARARYEELVLERAERVTPGRLTKYAQLTASRVGKVSFQDRHKKAREARCVRLSDEDDGMATLTLYVTKLLGTAIWDRLTEQAKAIHSANTCTDDQANTASDPRTFDQIRADLATELLLTGQPTGGPDAPHAAGIGIRAEVSVVVPVLSLLGQGKVPAVLAGHGPIGMDDALRLAADAPEWVRVLTDPVAGMVLTVDKYRPSKRLRRFLQVRDGRCRYPVCNRAPQRTEIDHTFAWEFGGKTTPENLECLCKGDHTLKHHSAWTVRQVAPGILEWTSPLGQIITDLPDNDIPGNIPPF